MTEDITAADLHKYYSVDGFIDRQYPFIAVEGPIGVGKTELCHMLRRVKQEMDKMPTEVLLEPVRKPTFRRLLGQFYTDMKRWAFAFQMYALKERFQQHTYAAELVLNKTAVIQDRSIFADGCFAAIAYRNGNMTKDEWEIYAETFGHMKRNLRYPDIMVFLDCPPEICLKRINTRARSEEGGIPLEYLVQLDEEHNILADQMSRFTRVMRIDWSQFGRDIEDVNTQINQVLAEDRRMMRDFRRL